ncbi:hypothetical protein QZH41_013539 [Actinostola sp. cb2023]|nr:hypothetical protein QZH41_013539 [Actinostola sp. cb2023]
MCSLEVSGFQVPGYWLVDSKYPRFKGENHYYRTDFILSSKNCLTFFYIINGTNPGRLNVYLGGYLGNETLLWRLAGQQGEHNSWLKAQVPISSDIAYQIIFKAIVGNEYGGFIAVDNITLSVEKACSFFPSMAQNHVLSGMRTNMIGHIPSYQDWLLSQAGIGNKYWEPCFQTLKDGWNADIFLKKCSRKGPLVFLIRRESQILGGFTDVNHLNEYLGMSKDYAFNRPAFLSSVQNHNTLASAAVDVLQNKRDEYCTTNESNDQIYYARYDRDHRSTVKQWRCYTKPSLTGDGQRYDINKLSTEYFSRHNKLLELQTSEQSRAEQSRAEQSRAEQSRAEQSRAEQSRAEQSRAEQSRAEQSRAEQSRAEQSRAEQSRAEQSRAEQSRAEQSRAEQSRVE